MKPLTAPIPARAEHTELDPSFVVVDAEFADQLRTDKVWLFEIEVEQQQVLTREPRNVGSEAVAGLDERGLIRIGEAVTEHTILVGRNGPVEERDLTAEDRLLRAISSDDGKWRNASFRAPEGCRGIVTASDLVGAVARIMVTAPRPLAVGDLLRIDEVEAAVCAIDNLERDIAWSGSRTPKVAKLRCAADVCRGRSVGAYDQLTKQPSHEAPRAAQFFLAPQAELLLQRAPWVVWEMYSLKSDATRERVMAYEAMLKLENPGNLGYYAKSVTVRDDPADRKPREAFADVFEPGERRDHPLLDIVNTLQAHVFACGVDLSLSTDGARASMSAVGVEQWSRGRVSTPVTWDEARTPSVGGPLCERIFGPVRDCECRCGKYDRIRFRGVVCEECGVAVVDSAARRTWFGHIELLQAVRHPWFPDAQLTSVPVLPADLQTSDITRAYVQLLEAGTDLTATTAVEQLFATLGARIDELWREHVFTKTVDYSGSAPLVVDTSLGPGECRLPQLLAFEMFLPTIAGVLEHRGHCSTIKTAKKMIRRRTKEAHMAMEEVVVAAPILLMTEGAVVARRVQVWEELAVAVDESTSRRLGEVRVTLHAPITYQARFECSPLLALPKATSSPASGWLSQARGGSLVEALRSAALEHLSDPLDDPLLALALGREPEPPPQDELSAYVGRVADRRKLIRQEYEAAVQAEVQAGWKYSRELSNTWINELELSVRTFNALMNVEYRGESATGRRSLSAERGGATRGGAGDPPRAKRGPAGPARVGARARDARGRPVTFG